MNFENPDEALDRAFEYYKEAQLLLDRDKIDDLVYYNLGWLYYKYNDYANSFNSFSRLYINDPHNPILSYNLGNIYYHENNLSFAKIEYDKAIEYYQAIADKIGYINPDLNRHKEIYSQLARSYNNRGVTYASMARKYPQEASKFEQNALLDFYKAKDNANKINVIYNYAEYNIKYMVNRSIKKSIPALDNELVKRTTLQRFTEEYREKMISNI
jgi:tetratricopeptide (TPR) repeat protein